MHHSLTWSVLLPLQNHQQPFVLKPETLFFEHDRLTQTYEFVQLDPKNTYEGNPDKSMGCSKIHVTMQHHQQQQKQNNEHTVINISINFVFFLFFFFFFFLFVFITIIVSNADSLNSSHYPVWHDIKHKHSRSARPSLRTLPMPRARQVVQVPTKSIQKHFGKVGNILDGAPLCNLGRAGLRSNPGSNCRARWKCDSWKRLNLW